MSTSMFFKLCCRAPRIRIASTPPANPASPALPSPFPELTPQRPSLEKIRLNQRTCLLFRSLQFDVQCSTFDVRCSTFAMSLFHGTPNFLHKSPISHKTSPPNQTKPPQPSAQITSPISPISNFYSHFLHWLSVDYRVQLLRCPAQPHHPIRSSRICIKFPCRMPPSTVLFQQPYDRVKDCCQKN